jgi:hypothetical protein
MNRRFVRGSLVVGAVGLLLCAVGLLVAPRQAYFSWLFAWGFAASLALGALILVLMFNAANGRWFLLFRRLAEAMAGSLLPLALLFVPIFFGLGHLYPWAAAGAPADEHVAHALAHKQAYLNGPFFVVRALVIFAFFAIVVLVLRRASLRQDTDGDIALVTRQRVFSSAMLPPVAIALTFGAIDWFMSLSVTWYSSVYGIYYWAGGFVGAIGLLVIVARRAEVPGVRPAHYYALGRLLLAFTIFWTYIAYAQGFIIWIGNKPEEVTWYVLRTHGSWAAVAIVLLFAHFVIPFFVLLLRFLKYQPRRLAIIGGWILAAHLIDVYWIVMPELHVEGFRPHWLDLAALAAVLGLCAAWCGVWLRGHSLVPERAPGLPIGLAYDASMTAGGDEVPA